MKKIILLCLTISWMCCASAQTSSVPFNGVILSIDGKPLKRVKVWVKAPEKYAISDKKGRFGLTDVQPTDTLKLRFQKRDYFIPVDGKKSVRIRLADAKVMEADESQELVDMGYGYVNRREFTGSSNRLSGEDFRRAGYTSLSRALQGRVPGLNITNSTDGGSTTMNIRGINSIYGSSQPLIMLDGTEISDLDGVDIQNVDYVEVLKDGSMYGVRGANGVILITTLKGTRK